MSSYYFQRLVVILIIGVPLFPMVLLLRDIAKVRREFQMKELKTPHRNRLLNEALAVLKYRLKCLGGSTTDHKTLRDGIGHKCYSRLKRERLIGDEGERFETRELIKKIEQRLYVTVRK